MSAVEGAGGDVELTVFMKLAAAQQRRDWDRTNSRLWHSVSWRTWRELAQNLPGHLLVRHRARSEVDFGERM